MSHWSQVVALAVFAAGVTACASGHRMDGIEPPSGAGTVQTHYYNVDVPQELEIRSAGLAATVSTDVQGSKTATSSSIHVRSYVTVYAVHRRTGEAYLLVYENYARPTPPIQVIHLRSSTDIQLRSDSTQRE